jgi:hypothetical protein
MLQKNETNVHLSKPVNKFDEQLIRLVYPYAPKTIRIPPPVFQINVVQWSEATKNRSGYQTLEVGGTSCH